MKDLELITSKVYKDINQNDIMIFYTADLNDIPPFMCSPYSEGWFWSKNTKELFDYIFEVIIANYLINDVMSFRDFNNIGNKDYDFIESIKIYKQYKKMNEKRFQSLNKLLSLYEDNMNKEISYKDLVIMLYNIEEIIPYTGVELKFETYSCPLETRHSRNLKNDKFNFKNLNENY